MPHIMMGFPVSVVACEICACVELRVCERECIVKSIGHWRLASISNKTANYRPFIETCVFYVQTRVRRVHAPRVCVFTRK